MNVEAKSGSGAAAARHPMTGRAGAPDERRPLSWRDVRGDTRRRADELVCTESEAVALEALRTATGETDGDMERHTVRQYLIAERLADTRGIAYDREVLLCASFLHDTGLYRPASTGDVYIKDSARYARRTLEPLGWPEERLRVCIDACEQHHALSRGGGCTMRSSLSGGPTSSRSLRSPKRTRTSASSTRPSSSR